MSDEKWRVKKERTVEDLVRARLKEAGHNVTVEPSIGYNGPFLTLLDDQGRRITSMHACWSCWTKASNPLPVYEHFENQLPLVIEQLNEYNE